MWTAVVTLTILAGLAGLLLGLAQHLANRDDPGSDDELVDRIDELLPQTQCAQCGYPGCRPYAAAIAGGQAPINLCPPGGETTVRRLADLLGRDPLPLDGEVTAADRVAFIDEQRCIGCTYCRAACPVDAVLGARQFMHTIIESECTGCELCIAPCPVDCITMRERAGDGP